jgi:hypothetical protein
MKHSWIESPNGGNML